MGAHVVIAGAGAVGGSLGAWLVEAGVKTTFFARGKTADTLKTQGITAYLGDEPQDPFTSPVNVVTELGAVTRPDVVLLATKTYSLPAMAGVVSSAFGRDVPVVALQNGDENQRILPKYFDHIVYGIVHYNSWQDSPGVVGYQKKGSVVLAVDGRDKLPLAERARNTLGKAVDIFVTDRLQDAVYSKLVINLTNSLTTLIGFPQRPASDPALFQRLLTQLTYEGVRVVKAAGYREYRVPGSPSWLLMTLGAKLPRFVTKRAFEKNVRKMRINSMAQDIGAGRDATELDDLTGRILQLADEFGVAVPYNREVYRLCKERFAKTPFEPMSIEEVVKAVSP